MINVLLALFLLSALGAPAQTSKPSVIRKKQKIDKAEKTKDSTREMVVYIKDTETIFGTDPQPITSIDSVLVYPPEALRLKKDGNVTIVALIDTDGTVIHSYIEQAYGTLYTQAATDAIHKTKFIPATLHGAPIRKWFKTTIMFRVPD